MLRNDAAGRSSCFPSEYREREREREREQRNNFEKEGRALTNNSELTQKKKVRPAFDFE